MEINYSNRKCLYIGGERTRIILDLQESERIECFQRGDILFENKNIFKFLGFNMNSFVLEFIKGDLDEFYKKGDIIHKKISSDLVRIKDGLNMTSDEFWADSAATRAGGSGLYKNKVQHVRPCGRPSW